MPGDMKYQIIYEDDDILVVDKPSGLRTIPDGYQPLLPCLASLLRSKYGIVYVVHRLDKDTSGVMLFAKNVESHRNLNKQFHDRSIVKTYHAICAGYPEWKTITADFPLLVNGDRQHRTIIDNLSGKSAKTYFSTINSAGEYHIISAQPHNGYTHIIRAHAAALAIPLLSDPLYHNPTVPKNVQMRLDVIPRIALHSWQIQFTHPVTRNNVSFRADYPPDFVNAALQLGLL